jgi:23S rRNA (uridine2552-2'-O)-methyltransferase
MSGKKGPRPGGSGNRKNQASKAAPGRAKGPAKPSNPRAVLDHYSLQAQKEGYPARSVYKLQEIQERFQVFPREGRILDVGAAPGSWSLFVLRNTGPGAVLAAVDLKPLANAGEDPRFHFIQGDFFAPENLNAFLGWGPYDTVLSDAAPATTGNRTVDTSRSAGLVEGILYQARNLLRPGGNLVVKLFLGGEEQNLAALFRQNFRTVKMFKPKACRKESFETFLIGLDYHPPENCEEEGL